MQGRRVDAKPDDADQWPFPRLKSGEYGKDIDGVWYCVPPGTEMLGCLGDGVETHKVIENADGTISVSPSILIGAGPDQKPWHGYLENGVWREC